MAGEVGGRISGVMGLWITLCGEEVMLSAVGG